MEDKGSSVIKEVTIMTFSGAHLYHIVYHKDTMDPFLYSGFVNTVINFSREFGNKITSINYNQIKYHFTKLNSLIIIVGVESGMSDDDQIEEFIQRIGKSKEFKKLEDLPKVDNFEVPKTFENFMIETLNHISAGSILSENSNHVYLSSKAS